MSVLADDLGEACRGPDAVTPHIAIPPHIGRVATARTANPITAARRAASPVFFAAASLFDPMVSPHPTEIPSVVAQPRPLNTAASLLSEIYRLRSVCAELEAARGGLIASLAQYTDDNAALRASALLWIELYERQLRRANALAEVVRAESDRRQPRVGLPAPGIRESTKSRPRLSIESNPRGPLHPEEV